MNTVSIERARGPEQAPPADGGFTSSFPLSAVFYARLSPMPTGDKWAERVKPPNTQSVAYLTEPDQPGHEKTGQLSYDDGGWSERLGYVLPCLFLLALRAASSALCFRLSSRISAGVLPSKSIRLSTIAQYGFNSAFNSAIPALRWADQPEEARAIAGRSLV